MDADEIARLRALLAKAATPGRWAVTTDGIVSEDDDGGTDFCAVATDAAADDERLIVAAVNALPALLDALDEARRLPVIPTCGDCAECYPPSRTTSQDDRRADCSHVDAIAGRTVDRNAAPPDWCPWRKRGARRVRGAVLARPPTRSLRGLANAIDQAIARSTKRGAR